MDTPAITIGQLITIMDGVRALGLKPRTRQNGETAATLIGNLNILHVIACHAVADLPSGETRHELEGRILWNSETKDRLTREITPA